MHYFDECIRNLANDSSFIERLFSNLPIFSSCRPSPTNEEVNVIGTSYENGISTCKFSFEITSQQVDGEPIPIGIDKRYYLLFAAGSLTTEGKYLIRIPKSIAHI